MRLQISFGFSVEFRGDGSPLLGHEQVAGIVEICHRAVDLFGGYTRFDTFGQWRDSDTKLIVAEEGRTISVLVDSEESGVEGRVCDLAQQIKTSLQQKAVAVTYTRVEVNIF